MDEEKRRKELERLEATLKVLDKFRKQMCSPHDAFTSFKNYMDNSDYIYLFDKYDEEKLSHIHSELQINHALLRADQLDPSEIITKSTALYGTYFKRCHNAGYDMTKSKSALLKLKGNLQPKLKTPNKEKCNIEVPFDEENVTIENQYSFTITCISSVIIPMALWQTDLTQLTLSENVIDKLKCIQNCLGTEEATSLAISFLREYGSHLYLGDIHFGGTFKLETTFEGLNVNEKAVVKDGVRYRHRVSLGWGVSECKSFDDPLSQKGKFPQEEVKDIKPTLSRNGGPQHVSSFLLWEKGLVYNNSTWVIIHTGEPKEIKGKLVLENYIGIWDLIKMEENENSLEVASLLKQIWKETSGFELDDVLCETLETMTCKWDFKSCIDDVTNQLIPTMEAQSYVDGLQILHDKIVKYKTVQGCKEVWKHELHVNVFITEVLLKVTTIEFSKEQRIMVKSLIEGIFQYADGVDFLNKHIIQLWLNYNISVNPESSLWKSKHHSLIDLLCSLTEFFKTIEIKHKTQDVDTMEDITLPQRETTEVEISIRELMNDFKTKADLENYLTLLSVVLQFDFDVNKGNFKSQLTLTKIKSFLEKLDNATTNLNKYDGRSTIVKQALAYHHLKESIINSGIHTRPIARQTFYKILKHIKRVGFNIDTRVVSVIDKVTNSLESKLKNLEARVSGPPEKSIISWGYFEDLPDIDCCDTTDPPEVNQNVRIIESKPLKNILDQFCLTNYFPGKLSLQNVLSLKDIHFKGASQMSDLPWAILHEIIAVNFNFRERVLYDFFQINTPIQEDEEDDDLLSWHSSKSINTTETSDYHPSDVFMAIYECCDAFLRRVLAQKIALCQLALPFMFEDHSSGDFVLSLWPLRDIYIESKSESVATQSFKTVSFIRIGRGLPKSKSSIINEFLRDINEEHSTFFHRDCKLGMKKRTITEGMIEATWYIPNEKAKIPTGLEGAKKQQTEERLTVLNMRGDAHLFQKQIKTLLKITNLAVVLISSEDIQKEMYSETLKFIHACKCAVIVLTNLSMTAREIEFLETHKREQAIMKSKTKIITTFLMKDNRQMNRDELQTLVRRNVFGLLKVVDQGIKIEEMVTKFGIQSDESSKNLSMKEKAARIHAKIKKYSAEERKQILLPLQGDKLWQKWSKKQKEQKRPRYQAEKYDPEEKILKEMQELRLQQVKTCNKPPNIIAEFIHVLVEIVHDTESTAFFLCWIRQFLDDESRIAITRILDEFSEAFEKYESTEGKTQENKQKMYDIDKKLADTSFGLEHLYREIGQVYEAFVYTNEDKNCTIAVETQHIISLLPMVAAKALLLGQPLELMDGDAANVPLKWIRAVFREIKILIGDVRILSISVLGIQSSGKSTLLNTMFGLRFPVSAGRCTRGIFAQLLPVDKSESSLTFDYVLVIDTEGLRAPELAGEKVTHDNELATLVIGAADVVLINIKGEAIADMQDVLQIVIHGLMRIQQVNKDFNLRQSSMFVHQNVSAEDAKKQMMQGNNKIIENLDKITKEVAIQEQFENISSFRDVIRFDPTKDVRFVPDLWHGGRKMTPASPQYSLTVNVVAQDLLNCASSKNHSILTIENTFLYFESLWNGILAEDFVFSFRNCLEVKAYSLLENEYQKFNFSLNMLKLDWILDNVKPKLSCCKTTNDLETISKTLFNEFEQKLEIQEETAVNNLNTFIDHSELNDHMIHWKEHKIRCLQGKAASLKEEMKEKIRSERDKSHTAISHGTLLVKKEAQINEKAKAVASSLIGKDLTQSKMQTKFDELWKLWLEELVPKGAVDKTKDRIIQMKMDIKNTLNERFWEHRPLLRNSFKETPIDTEVNIEKLENSINVADLKQEHVKINTKWAKMKRFVVKIDKNVLVKHINIVLATIDVMFADLLKTDSDYEKTHFCQILELAKNGIESYNNLSGQELTFRIEFQIFFAIHVSRYSCSKYKNIIRCYEKKHDIMANLLKYKPQAQRLFIDVCEAKSQEIQATHTLCGYLKDLIKERVERNIYRKIPIEINERYFSRKSSLMKTIMEELADINNFERYMNYIKSPASYVFKWITDKTNDVVFTRDSDNEESMFDKWTFNDTTNVVDSIKEAVDTTAKSLDEKSEFEIEMWKSVFVKILSEQKLLLTSTTFEHVKGYRIKSFKEFRENVKKELSELELQLVEEFNQMEPNSMQWPNQTPYQCIFETLWGCQETCPICSEPCQRSQANHASKKDHHTCIQHRCTAANGISSIGSGKLTTESCNFKVQSTRKFRCGKWCKCPNTDTCEKDHPYKEYKKYCPDWDIEDSTDHSRSVYWNWFVATHSSRLAEYYGAEMPDIPETWHDITKEKAIESLESVYLTL